MVGETSLHDYSTPVALFSRTIIFKQNSHASYNGNAVALKVTAGTGALNGALHPSLHEANVYKLLCPHPSVPDYVDCVEDWFDTDRFLNPEMHNGKQRLPVLVMQFVKAVSVDRFLRSVRVIRWSVAVDIANKVGGVLEHMHTKGVVYRDLKLPNVVVGLKGHVWVVDYASAVIASKEPPLCGVTNHLRPPELYGFPNSSDDEPSTRSRLHFTVDFWVFGAFLLEMLTGRPYLGSFDVESADFTQEQLDMKVLEGVAVIKDRYKGVYYDRRFNGNVSCATRTLWESLTELLLALLRYHPKERLGYNGGWNAVKQHNFFKHTRCDLPVPFPPSYDEEVEELTSGF